MRRLSAPVIALVLLTLGASSSSAQGAPSAADRKDVQAKIAAAMTAQAEPSDAVALPPARKPNGKIKESFDRFTQSTEVNATVIKTGLFSMHMLGVEAYFGYPGKTLQAPPRYVLVQFRPDKTTDWRLLKNHDVVFLVNDSVSVSAPLTFHDGEVDEHPVMVREQVTAAIPLRDYVTIANAHSLEVRVGDAGAAVQHKFKPDELQTLQDLAGMLNPAR